MPCIKLPSGVFRQNIVNVIGNGVALSVENFINEVNSVVERGVPAPKLLVSDRCQVVMPYHKELDGMEEARLAAKSFGSTKSGIAPFYSDKYAKIGFQVSDLFDDKDSIMERIDHVLGLKNVLYTQLYHQKPLDREEIYQKLMEYKEALAPYVADTTTLLHNAVKEGKTILLEGQLGSLKDPDMGIYPMVTSSSPWRATALWERAAFRPTPSRRLSPWLRPTPVLWAPGSLSAKSSATRQRSCAGGAATAASTAPPQGVPAAWAGWIWWLPAMAAWCRGPQRWPIRISI